ncbi:MAG: excalibur calcium-binding domain-containing protein [Thiotrichaceae bacterium]|nr:excalibur calcium-binding domain-containing protein [Thiotrichaceae bacterium]
MENLIKGKLQRWDDEKGFGFILPETGNKSIFMHISALRNSSRRPKVGDIILYQLFTMRDGKLRAINARIEGVAERNSNKLTWKKVFSKLFKTIIFIGVAIVFVKTLLHDIDERRRQKETNSTRVQNNEQPKSNRTYACDGRTSCAQMSSCEEARFFLRNCPNTQMDGDHDGIPCERGLCR